MWNVFDGFLGFVLIVYLLARAWYFSDKPIPTSRLDDATGGVDKHFWKALQYIKTKFQNGKGNKHDRDDKSS